MVVPSKAEPHVIRLAIPEEVLLHVWLFLDVTNSKQLQEAVVSHELQPELALLNAAMVPDLSCVQLAAHQALVAQKRGSLTTKSLHAELVFNISGSKHTTSAARVKGGTFQVQLSLIKWLWEGVQLQRDEVKKQISESFRNFGIQPDTRHLLACRFNATDAEVSAIPELVSGQALPLGQLASLTDMAMITKFYRVGPQELKIGSMADAALMRIAARNC